MGKIEIMLCFYGLFSVFYFCIIFQKFVLKRLPLATYYVRIYNYFFPNNGYKLFEKTKIMTTPYWKEIIGYLLKIRISSSIYPPYNRRYLKNNVIFDSIKIKTFNDYDISLMNGVSIKQIKKQGGITSGGFFKISIININQNPFNSHYLIYKHDNKNGKTCIYTIVDQFDYKLLELIFKDTLYWKPIFNEKYRNWQEFDRIYKVKNNRSIK